MVRLGPAAQDRQQRVPGRPDVPAADARARVRSTVTTWPGPARRTSSWPSMSRSRRSAASERAGAGVGEVLGGDQVLVGRQAHVADVDAAEQAVPVAVVRLAAVEVVDRQLAGRSRGHRVDLVGRPEHLLVEVVDLAVLDLEVAPERAAQPARLGPTLRLGGVEDGRRRPGSRRPAAPTRPSRRTSRSGRRPARSAGARPARPTASSSSASRRWPRAPRRTGRPSGPRPSSAPRSSATRRTSRRRRPSSRPARRPRSRARAGSRSRRRRRGTGSGSEGPARCRRRSAAGPGPRSCTGPRGPPRGSPRPGSGRRRAPSSRSRRPPATSAGPAPRPARRARRRSGVARTASPARRPSGAAGRSGRARAATRGPARSSRRRGSRPGRARRARASRLDELGSLVAQPLEQRPGVVEGQPDARVALEGLEHRQVGLVVDVGEDPAEVADRLVVVDGEGERDPGGHGALSRLR